MNRIVCFSLVLVLGTGCNHAARAQYPGLLADPGDYSFAPPAYRQGGVASASVGSHNMQSGSIRMDSGLIGNTGMRAFVALGGGHGDLPDRVVSGSGDHGGKLGVTSRGAAIGIEKSFADGMQVGLNAEWERDSLSFGRRRQGVYDAAGLP